MTGNWSLKARLIFAGLLLVGTFLLLIGVALEQAFRSSAELAREERLQARVYMLMAQAEAGPDGIVTLAGPVPDPDMAVPDSGVYGNVSSSSGDKLWQSESSIADTPAYPRDATPGQRILRVAQSSQGNQVATLSIPVIWELEGNDELSLVFQSGENTRRVEAEVRTFRLTLQKWLGGAAVVLMSLQLLMLLWVMRPLNQVTREISEVEAGQRDELSRSYPTELSQLTDHLNNLIKSNKQRLLRYRNALGDLAHSMKTPLASARLQIESQEFDRSEVLEQLDDIDTTIEYQLRRASASGRSPLAKPILVKETVDKVVRSLQKVYQEKALQFETQIPDDTIFYGDPGDLTEIAGNLCDNACKWTHSRVLVQAANFNTESGQTLLRLIVSDDGKGITKTMRNSVLARGVRADTRRPGQGIGLASVHEMVVDVYDGRIEINESEFGGATIVIEV